MYSKWKKGVARRGIGEGIENISVCGFGRPPLKALEAHLNTIRLKWQFPGMLITERPCLLSHQKVGQPQ